MSETQLDRIERRLEGLDRLERKFDAFVDYVQARFEAVDTAIAELRVQMSETRAELGETRSELGGLRAEFEGFRIETREKLENLSDRMTLHERSLAHATLGTNRLHTAVWDIATKLNTLESMAFATNLRIMELRNDMQQRFRLVNDRLASLKKKLAA